ncbi:unnamed protein product [Parnassius apollo]|uniref:(apollo) hypothetical protein n=1 Tax=Parnassius apollo TaxID=110799 RepID=A0A8S3XPZ3_PARAO|nr:unnamed protein product [Parnassius apollo]
MSLSSKKCCVPGCLDSGSMQMPLHLFPNPEKDRLRFNIWVHSIGGPLALPKFTFVERRPLRQMKHSPEDEPSTTKDFAVDAMATSSTYAWMKENIDPSVNIPEVSNIVTEVNAAEKVIPEVSNIIKESAFEINVSEKIYNWCTKRKTKTIVSKKIKAVTTLEHDYTRSLFK